MFDVLIQASLDEDIENRKIEYSEKLESINKKLDYSRKKADDEKIRLQNEFQEQVNVSMLTGYGLELLCLTVLLISW